MAKLRKAKPIVKERRASIRIPVSKILQRYALKFQTGQGVELVDINVDNGIRIKSKIILRPGSNVRLILDTPQGSYNLGGCIRRCRIFSIGQEEIEYEAAVILDEIIPQQLNAELQRTPRRPLYAWLETENASSPGVN